MKTPLLKIAALLAAFPNYGASQAFETETIGRELYTIEAGFNYFGVRFHEPLVASSDFAFFAGDDLILWVGFSVTDTLQAGTSYLFEVETGGARGAVIPITSFDATTGIITLNDDIAGVFQYNDEFSIRPASTIASIFGADNSAGLHPAFTGTDAEQVWLPDGSGGFTKYFYYEFFGTGEWRNVDTNSAIDPEQVVIYYPDGIIIKGISSSNTFVIKGFLKKNEVAFALTSGFNYVSSVYPTGSTIASMFGPNNEAGLDPGFGGSGGSDSIWLPNSNGGFDKYHYDLFSPITWQPAWTDQSDGSPVDPESISLNGTSGFVILNSGAAQGIEISAPGFYNSL